jgi:hypothetical protein
MTYHKHLREGQWKRICSALSGRKWCVGRSVSENRKFVEAVIWIGKNGGRRRCLPEEYGHEVASISALSAGQTMRFRQWDLADDFQHIARRCRYGMGDD